MTIPTLFLRLEGPLQAWGVPDSKFVIRRTAAAPTKSGVIGLLCAALGVSRVTAAEKWLSALATLHMGVRVDRPGVRWWDYHTVGAGMKMRTAEGKTKDGAMLTRREYLCDASFLVALQGESSLIRELAAALRKPCWPPYLGRKACSPSRPLLEHPDGAYPDVLAALSSIPWRPRLRHDTPPEAVDCLLDWISTASDLQAPDEAEVWFDVPVSFDPPAHQPRFVLRRVLRVGDNGSIMLAEQPAQQTTPRPPRPRADYRNTEYRRARATRLAADHQLCIFCKSPATTVQHITYRRAGGHEIQDDLRSLCRLCHDAVTMLEYGHGMGMDRINPEDPGWRTTIMQQRREILQFRSLETRRRRLNAEEVE